MAYTFQYRLQSTPVARNDGSGQVKHEIYALSSPDGENWSVVPGHHKDMLVPASGLKTVMDMPDGTSEQKQAKNTAYKELLKNNRNTPSQPMRTDWTCTTLEQFMEANDGAALEATRANSYITAILCQSYPIDFNL
jgi:hypothetical protein